MQNTLQLAVIKGFKEIFAENLNTDEKIYLFSNAFASVLVFNTAKSLFINSVLFLYISSLNFRRLLLVIVP